MALGRVGCAGALLWPLVWALPCLGEVARSRLISGDEACVRCTDGYWIHSARKGCPSGWDNWCEWESEKKAAPNHLAWLHSCFPNARIHLLEDDEYQDVLREFGCNATVTREDAECPDGLRHQFHDRAEVTNVRFEYQCASQWGDQHHLQVYIGEEQVGGINLTPIVLKDDGTDLGGVAWVVVGVVACVFLAAGPTCVCFFVIQGRKQQASARQQPLVAPSPAGVVTVQCPPGAGPGTVLSVQDPATGQSFQEAVPAGVQPGGTFQVQAPTTATVVAAPVGVIRAL